MIVSRKQQYSLVIILTLQAISIILVRQKSANRDLSMYGIADRLGGITVDHHVFYKHFIALTEYNKYFAKDNARNIEDRISLFSFYCEQSKVYSIFSSG